VRNHDPYSDQKVLHHVALGVLQLGSNKFELDVAIDQAQQMIFRNLIFEPEVVKQQFRAGMVSHHWAAGLQMSC